MEIDIKIDLMPVLSERKTHRLVATYCTKVTMAKEMMLTDVQTMSFTGIGIQVGPKQ